MHNGIRFYPLGTNAYYLHKYSCLGDTNSIHELFKSAKKLNMNTIRLWAFSEGENENDISVLHYGPYKYNDSSFKKLDYIISLGKTYNIKFILTLANNWDDFGGVRQYLKWYANMLNKKIYSESTFVLSKFNNKFYNYEIAESIFHDDFYRIDTVKNWYKSYMKYILERKNTYTNIEYKNDTSIMAFELINEPESSDNTGLLINKWIKEMSVFFKSIDSNHLLSTGESGFDTQSIGYGKYASWILDGSKGVSFKLNSSIKEIDYTTAHLYSEVWNNLSGAEWIYDHKIISDYYNKPFLLGEFGANTNRKTNFTSWLTSLKIVDAGGALIWQLVPENLKYDDGYILKISQNMEECNIIKYYYEIIKESKKENLQYNFNIFPNPTKNEFYVHLFIQSDSYIDYKIYNVLGEVCFSEKRFFSKGENVLFVNIKNLASGVYFLNLKIDGIQLVKKVVLIK